MKLTTMAKDLSYFKFFCSEWTDGDITLEDYRIQGLFINICSYYWSNNCDVSITKLKKKFKIESETIDYLIKETLIKVKGQDIIISFLDEQLDERIETSKIKSKGGKASAEARRLKKLEQESNKDLTENEHVLNSCSTETQLLREDKIKEEKKRVYHTHETFIEWFNECRKFIKLQSNIKKLSTIEKQQFKELENTYTKEDFKKAFKNFSSDKYYKDNNLLFPIHFLKLENFTKYLNAEVKQELTLGQKLSEKQ